VRGQRRRHPSGGKRDRIPIHACCEERNKGGKKRLATTSGKLISDWRGSMGKRTCEKGKGSPSQNGSRKGRRFEEAKRRKQT